MADWLLKEWEQRGKEIAALESRVRELEAERDKLKALAEEAIESIEDWAGYADAYFQNKHDLQGELVRLRTALKDSKEN